MGRSGEEVGIEEVGRSGEEVGIEEVGRSGEEVGIEEVGKSGETVGRSGEEVGRSGEEVGIEEVGKSGETVGRSGEEVGTALALRIVVPIFQWRNVISNCSHFRSVKPLEYSLKVMERVLEKRLCRIVIVNEIEFCFMPDKW